MMSEITNYSKKSFEEIKMIDGELEFRSARQLMPILGYEKRQKFFGVIEKAIISCDNSGQLISNHFIGAGKKVKLGSGSQRNIDDYLLTRYACYLVAQNGDSRKPEIALAQTYFASQTRKQELHEKMIEENKRLEARAKLKISEEKIEETVYYRGISLPKEFATFKNKKIETLYNMSVKKLKGKRGIPEHRALADFDSEVELKAKDFIYAMTDHNIKEKNLIGKVKLEGELIENSKATRQTMLKRGIKPEELSPQEDLKKIEKKRLEEQKRLGRK